MNGSQTGDMVNEDVVREIRDAEDMRYLLLSSAGLFAVVLIFGISSEGNGIEKDTGRRCPGKFYNYGCTIDEGGYGEFVVGMSRSDVFEGICNRGLAREFKYIILDADASSVSNEVKLRWKPVVEAYRRNSDPTGTAYFVARSREELCALSEVGEIITELSIRYERFNKPSVLTLEFDVHVVDKIHLADHTIDL